MSLGPQCGACRKRRVRCDSARPACSKCAQKDIECPGYSISRALKWRYYVSEDALQHEPAVPRTSSFRGLYGRADDIASVEMVNYTLAYYNAKIVPDLAPCDSSGFEITPAIWLTFGLVERHLQLCVVTLHKAIQQLSDSQWSASSTVPRNLRRIARQEMVLFHHHQASAARILQHQIDRLQGNEPDQTLFSGIVMFLSSQIQQSAYGAWHAHLNGAKIMLDSWTPPGSELAIDKFLCFHLMVTDIYATATSPARQFSPTVAAQHCTYLDKMRHLNIDSSGLLTPIPNEIVLATIAINILRASRAASPMAHAHHEQGIEVSSAGLLASIQAFCPRSWSEKAFTNHATAAAYSVENPELSETLEGWRLMAQCFQAAAAMYLILSDVALEGNGFSEWDFARDSAYASLTVSIQRLFDLKQSGGKHHKFILWSIVIAGVEAAARGDRGVLEYLTFHLKVLTFDLGTMAMREAAYFLEHLWEDCARQRLDSAGYVRINWDRVFEARPVFLL